MLTGLFAIQTEHTPHTTFTLLCIQQPKHTTFTSFSIIKPKRMYDLHLVVYHET